MVEMMNPYLYNLDKNKFVENDGHEGYDSIVTAQKDCTTSADTIATITTSYKAYVTMIALYNSNASSQTFELLENTSTRILYLTVGAGETVIINADREPLMELAAGALKGDAGTGNYVHCTITYYEKPA